MTIKTKEKLQKSMPTIVETEAQMPKITQKAYKCKKCDEIVTIPDKEFGIQLNQLKKVFCPKCQKKMGELKHEYNTT